MAAVEHLGMCGNKKNWVGTSVSPRIFYHLHFIVLWIVYLFPFLNAPDDKL